jgi:hypothetical protein
MPFLPRGSRGQRPQENFQTTKMNSHKLQNIFNLSSKERYGYFVRKVADFQTVWLVRDDEGVAMLGGDEEHSKSIPVWPEKEFASLFLKGDWESYRVEEMPLDEFLIWLDELQKKGIQLATFPKESLQSIVVSAEEMKAHLLHELEQYE